MCKCKSIANLATRWPHSGNRFGRIGSHAREEVPQEHSLQLCPFPQERPPLHFFTTPFAREMKGCDRLFLKFR